PPTASRDSAAVAGYRAFEKDVPRNKVSTELSSNAKGEITIAPNAPSSPETAENDRIRGAAPSPVPPPFPSASAGGKIAEPRKEEQKKAQAANEATLQDQAAQLHQSSAASSTNYNLDELSLQQLAQVNRRYILSPGEKLAWRLGDSGKIERSTDHGKTWKLQDSGVTTDLTAGSATSDKICWIIGKAGTLLLTTDGGKHWKTIHSPIAGDLGGIHATDDVHASIWDVPNRQSYETSDGGATWTRIANE
ncbi:MAG TPA: YCF48-related protein, partial [Candidatus Acidoferrum sp.]|nr:YCF48-related protein [Candidatus Acidoferrum sp.]